MTLRYLVLNFFQRTTSLKPTSPFFNFHEHDIPLFSSQFIFSEKTAWFKPGNLFLDFLKNDIRLLSPQFSLKQQHASNQIAFL